MKQTIRFTHGSDRTRLAYAESGSGPPIVKAANWLSHLEFDWQSPVWRHWLGFFSRYNRLIRYDRRGCGLSDWDVEDLSFDAQVADLEAVVEAAGVERFVLVGISQGGAVSVEYALRHPERVSRLILYGASARGRNRRGEASARQFKAMVDLIRTGWGQENPAFRRLFTTLFIPDASEEQERWFTDLMRITSRPEIAARIWQAAAENNVVEKLPALRVPTLVLHARDDAVVPFSEGRLLAAGIPGASLISLESRNHILLESEAAWSRFCTEISQFLGRDAEHGAGMPDATRLDQLTERERTILGHLAHGLSNAEIAERVFISEKTVKNHLTNIFSKLDVDSRARAIALAHHSGLMR